MTKWEYQSAAWRNVGMMGREGWEAFAAQSDGILLLKRPIEEDPETWAREAGLMDDAPNVRPPDEHPKEFLDKQPARDWPPVRSAGARPAFEAAAALAKTKDQLDELNRNRLQLVETALGLDPDPEEIRDMQDAWVAILDAASKYVGPMIQHDALYKVIKSHYDNAPGTAIRDWDNGAAMAAEKIVSLLPSFNLGLREAIAMAIDPGGHWEEAAKGPEVVTGGRIDAALKKAEQIITLVRGE